MLRELIKLFYSIINEPSRSLRVGVSGSGELDIENGGVYSTTNASGNCLVGHNSSDVGTINQNSGAILDVAFKSGVDISGSWDVMKWDGTLTDNGLAFAPTVDQSRWSFEFVDTNSDSKDDTLRLIASSNGTATSNDVPYTWYDTYFSGLSNSTEYENLDTVDSDGDGLLNYLEFQSKTNPTDNGTVSSINDLKKYMVHDNVNVKLTQGLIP